MEVSDLAAAYNDGWAIGNDLGILAGLNLSYPSYLGPFSKDIYGAIIPEEDPAWKDVVSWAFYALFAADDPNYGNFDGLNAWGAALGLSASWATDLLGDYHGYNHLLESNGAVIGGDNQSYPEGMFIPPSV